jgi:broad specificity phosphatase PhoE
MSELLLVRHAQASFGGDDYDRLSELGHRQAGWLGAWFAERGYGFDAIVTGTLRRHRETAAGVVRGMGLADARIEENPAWNEFDFQTLVERYSQQNGDHPVDRSMPPRTYYRLLRDALLAWSEDAIDLGGDAMESWAGFRARIRGALDRIRTYGPERRVLVVSSGGALASALQHILDLPTSSMIQLNLQTCNTGMHRCYFNERSISLAGFNHVPHLESRERQRFTSYY